MIKITCDYYKQEYNAVALTMNNFIFIENSNYNTQRVNSTVCFAFENVIDKSNKNRSIFTRSCLFCLSEQPSRKENPLLLSANKRKIKIIEEN